MSESLKLGHNLDFSSCDIMVSFHKSSHILGCRFQLVHVCMLYYLKEQGSHLLFNAGTQSYSTDQSAVSIEEGK